jgi:hypothetical protein
MGSDTTLCTTHEGVQNLDVESHSEWARGLDGPDCRGCVMGCVRNDYTVRLVACGRSDVLFRSESSPAVTPSYIQYTRVKSPSSPMDRGPAKGDRSSRVAVAALAHVGLPGPRRGNEAEGVNEAV